MKFSLSWLKQYLFLEDQSLQQLQQLLTDAGIEVEGVEAKGISSPLIVVAQIKEAVQHPNADRLKVTQVDVGDGSLRQIVCGAQNYQVGDKVPCALPGAQLPNGMTIGETIMRKVESKGMLCAAAEIGLPPGEEGLLILPTDWTLGESLQAHFDSDVILDLEITPNRPDLLSYEGLARELAALLKRELTPIDAIVPNDFLKNEAFAIIEAQDACSFYTITPWNEVTIQPSPSHIVKALQSVGLQPICNAVDSINFMMLSTGQPMHVFDAEQVALPLCVRYAKEGETLHALNDETYTLSCDDLVIADASGQIHALAGIIGGKASMVKTATRSMLLEIAHFNPSVIRRSARNHGLMTDSSYRFERGVNVAAVPSIATQTITFIAKEVQASPSSHSVCAGQLTQQKRLVTLDLKQLDALVDNAISHQQAAEILTRLGLKQKEGNAWEVPNYRADLTRHIDLVEEIVRVYGLKNIHASTQGTSSPFSAMDRAYDIDMSLRKKLVALGFYECQTIKLISDNQLKDALPLRALQNGDVIRVKLPLSEDHVVMRPSLIPGLIQSAERNVRQQQKCLRFFEIGSVFRNQGGGKVNDLEADQLGIFLSGQAQLSTWLDSERKSDLFDLKATIEVLLPKHSIQFVLKPRESHLLIGDIKAEDQVIGVFARVNPQRERELGLPASSFIAELDLTKIRKLLSQHDFINDLPAFPASSRDIAIEMKNEVQHLDIETIFKALKEPLLVNWECFDYFVDPSGEKLAHGVKSIAYRLVYRAEERTLKAEEVDAAHQRLMGAIQASPLNLKIR